MKEICKQKKQLSLSTCFTHIKTPTRNKGLTIRAYDFHHPLFLPKKGPDFQERNQEVTNPTPRELTPSGKESVAAFDGRFTHRDAKVLGPHHAWHMRKHRSTSQAWKFGARVEPFEGYDSLFQGGCLCALTLGGLLKKKSQKWSGIS